MDQNETKLASWNIDKDSGRILAFLIFFILLLIFIASFCIIYLIQQSTTIIFLIIPVLLFLPLIPTFKELMASSQVFKEDMEVNITERGIYVIHSDTDKEDFLAWEQMKQYDILSLPSLNIVNLFVPKPSRFCLHGSYEDEYLELDANGQNSDLLKSYLKDHSILFGYVRS